MPQLRNSARLDLQLAGGSHCRPSDRATASAVRGSAATAIAGVFEIPLPRRDSDEVGPCKRSSEWDLDQGGPVEWLDAAESCVQACPIFDQCAAALDDAYPGWGPRTKVKNPAGVVWAGCVFDVDGKLLSEPALRRRAKADRASRNRRAQDEAAAAELDAFGLAGRDPAALPLAEGA